MSARRKLIAELSEDSMGGIATLQDVERAEQLVNAHAAEVLAADGQAYDGELVMYRQMVRTLRVLVEFGAWDDVRQRLWEHARDEAEARAGAESEPAVADFFQPGHTYAREHHASTIRFLVRYIDDSPEVIPYRVAFGWKTEDGDVCASPFDSDDFTGWTDVTEAGEAS